MQEQELMYKDFWIHLDLVTTPQVLNFLMMPINYDLQKVQAIEFNDQIRKANYSFELINNKLRIFPIPTKNINYI